MPADCHSQCRRRIAKLETAIAGSYREQQTALRETSSRTMKTLHWTHREIGRSPDRGRQRQTHSPRFQRVKTAALPGQSSHAEIHPTAESECANAAPRETPNPR